MSLAKQLAEVRWNFNETFSVKGVRCEARDTLDAAEKAGLTIIRTQIARQIARFTKPDWGFAKIEIPARRDLKWITIDQARAYVMIVTGVGPKEGFQYLCGLVELTRDQAAQKASETA